MKIYRIDYHIAQKADKEGKTVAKVTNELLEHLDISRPTLNAIRRAEYSNKKSRTRLNVHLLPLSYFFGCSIDRLVNQAPEKVAQADAK